MYGLEKLLVGLFRMVPLEIFFFVENENEMTITIIKRMIKMKIMFV